MCSCVQNCVSLEMSYLDKYRQEVLILSSADVTSMVRPVFTKSQCNVMLDIDYKF